MIIDTCQRIMRRLPDVTIQFCWHEGRNMSSDIISKFTADPIQHCMSSFWQNGPEIYRSLEMVSMFDFCTFKNGAKYYKQLSNIVTKHENVTDIIAAIALADLNLNCPPSEVDQDPADCHEFRSAVQHRLVAITTRSGKEYVDPLPDPPPDPSPPWMPPSPPPSPPPAPPNPVTPPAARFKLMCRGRTISYGYMRRQIRLVKSRHPKLLNLVELYRAAVSDNME